MKNILTAGYVIRKFFFLYLALATTFLGSALGQSLSKSDIPQMQKAGVDKSIMMKKIGRDCISFEMSADTILELKTGWRSSGPDKCAS